MGHSPGTSWCPLPACLSWLLELSLGFIAGAGQAA